MTFVQISQYTGIPVLVLDKGDYRERQCRYLHLILAEKGTGFTLWRDQLDPLSDYKQIESTFHTMRLSDDHKTFAGLSFDNAYAATQFYLKLEQLCTDRKNIMNGLMPPRHSDPGVKFPFFFLFLHFLKIHKN